MLGVLIFLSGCDRPDGKTEAGGAEKPAAAQPLSPAEEESLALWPQVTPGVELDPAIEASIGRLLADMSVEEKVGQIIQADINSVTPEDVRQYRLGSILAGGNSAPAKNVRSGAQAWLDLADAFHAANAQVPRGRPVIPLIFGVDAVHGHNNVVGATVFPHNIGLGAAHDPELIGEIGAVTAREMAVTGIDWNFSPTVAVARDDRWGRTYESWSEDPALVATYAKAMVEGLQGVPGTDGFLGEGKVIATVKHFAGDGGTVNGKDQGDVTVSHETLRDIHVPAYIAAVKAGVRVVMASYNSWNGKKMHGNAFMLRDVLKGRFGFNGFIVGDWNGHGQVAGCENDNCPASIIAGLDMFMAPDSWKGLYVNTLAAVKAGRIPAERLDDAVRRILRIKMEAGLFEKPRPSERALAGQFELLASPAHRDVARRAVRQSLVLLKNENRTLPVKPTAHVLVAGDGAQNMGKQTGGWTLSWQGDGNSRADFPNGETIFEGIEAAVNGHGKAVLSPDGSFTERPDVAIVVFGEDPYAEFRGDRKTLDYQPDGRNDLAILKRLKTEGIPVVSVFLSGRPLWVNPELNASDAFVAAWLPGTEGGGVADLLIGKEDGTPRHDFSGRLSFSWPKTAEGTPLNAGDPDYAPLFALRYGLTYASGGTVGTLSEDSGVAEGSGTSGVFYAKGAAIAPWTLELVEGTGDPVPVQGARTATASGALTAEVTDRDGQEDALSLQWSGSAPARLVLSGPATDFRREANGDVTLQIAVRLNAPLTGSPVLAMSCGGNCSGAVDAKALLAHMTPGEWGSAKVKLSCFGASGLDLARVNAPLVLASDTALSLSISEIRLGSSEGAEICPPAAPLKR